MANLFLIIWRWNFTFTSGLKFLSDYIGNFSVKVKLDKTVRENLQESYFAFKSSNCPGDFFLRIKFMTVIQPSISTQELFCAWRCQKRKHWGRACLALGPRFKCYYNTCVFLAHSTELKLWYPGWKLNPGFTLFMNNANFFHEDLVWKRSWNISPPNQDKILAEIRPEMTMNWKSVPKICDKNCRCCTLVAIQL